MRFYYNDGDVLTFAPRGVSTVGRRMSLPWVRTATTHGLPVSQWTAPGGTAHTFYGSLTDQPGLTWTQEN